jgi:hypothetical protein
LNQMTRRSVVNNKKQLPKSSIFLCHASAGAQLTLSERGHSCPLGACERGRSGQECPRSLCILAPLVETVSSAPSAAPQFPLSPACASHWTGKRMDNEGKAKWQSRRHFGLFPRSNGAAERCHVKASHRSHPSTCRLITSPTPVDSIMPFDTSCGQGLSRIGDSSARVGGRP